MLGRDAPTRHPVRHRLRSDAAVFRDFCRSAQAADELAHVHGAEDINMSFVFQASRNVACIFRLPDALLGMPKKRSAASDVLKAIGRRLSLVRQAQNLSQAEAADVMAVTSAAVSAWEIGRNAISAVALVRLAEFKHDDDEGNFPFVTDYVLLGKIDFMPHKTMVRIQELERAAQGVVGIPRRGRPRNLVTVGEANRSESPVNSPPLSRGRKLRRA